MCVIMITAAAEKKETAKRPSQKQLGILFELHHFFVVVVLPLEQRQISLNKSDKFFQLVCMRQTKNCSSPPSKDFSHYQRKECVKTTTSGIPLRGRDNNTSPPPLPVKYVQTTFFFFNFSRDRRCAERQTTMIKFKIIKKKDTRHTLCVVGTPSSR